MSSFLGRRSPLVAVAALALLIASCGGSDGADDIAGTAKLDVTGISGDEVVFPDSSRLIIQCLEDSEMLQGDAIGIAYSSPRFLDWIESVFSGDFAEPDEDLINDPDSFFMVMFPVDDIELGEPLTVEDTNGSVFVLDGSDEAELASNAGGGGVEIEFTKSPCVGEGDELEVTIVGQLGDERGDGTGSIEATIVGRLES